MRNESLRASAWMGIACGALLLTACEKTRTVTREVVVPPPESTYLVEYLPGATAPAEGKSRFQLRVRNRATFAAAGGLALTVKATMDMGSTSHGTPVESVVESATPGTYDVTLYYLMGDAMGGMPAGYWSLDVTIPLAAGTETHTITPSVASAPMGETTRQRLYGPADVATSATMPDAYYLFLDDPVSAAAGELHLYLTRAGDMVTTFAPVTAATLTASSDTAFTSPVAATHVGNGHWTIPLTGFILAEGTPTPIHVKLAVAGESKTTNGQAPSGANAHATFTVVPREGYVVEYLPGAAAPAEGKSRFQLRVRNRATFAAATGLAPTVRATMDMGTMSHGTPVESVVESATPGTYDVTLYYLMGDAMGAMPAGYWTLEVGVGSQTFPFYPAVASAPMGSDTRKQRLYGPADVAMGAAMPDAYYLFADAPVASGAPVLSLYLSHATDMVTTFAPVSAAALSASLTADFASVIDATHVGGGHWTIALPALPAGRSSVHVKLTVGGEAKTTNGQAPSGANAYATFEVTPQ
ncbi:MAG: hypothetical protein HZB56_03375 [Deltaproteobacteria bacterium]|nr:hypothetical protein [Deltaproteobacteria bacterium]